MEMRFNVVFKRGLVIIATIEGQRAVKVEDLPVANVMEMVLTTEQHLEQLTGLRVHIEQVG